MKWNWLKVVGALALGAMLLTGCKKETKTEDTGGKTVAKTGAKTTAKTGDKK